MKKRRIAAYAGAVIATAVLASCGNNKTTTTPAKTDIMEGEIVEVNLPDEEYKGASAVDEAGVESLAGTKTLSSFKNDGVSVLASTDNLLVLENAKGYVGLYSKIAQKYIVAPKFYNDWIQSKQAYTSASSDVGEIYAITYQDTLHVYDMFGNVLYEDEGTVTSVKGTEVQGVTYLVLTLKDGEGFTVVKNFKYESTDKAPTEIDTIPKDANTSEKGIKYDDFDAYEYGETYVTRNKIDLDEYGMDGKYLVHKDELFTLYNDDNTKVATFQIPEEASWYIVGKYIIYQEYTEVPDEDATYDFSWGTYKYSLATYKINMETSEVTTLNTSYVLDSGVPYKDASGLYKYLLVSGGPIDANKAVNQNHTYIVNDNLEIIADISSVEADNFIKLGNNYYNTSTKVIYDSSMKELSYLADANPVLYKDFELFVCHETVDGVTYYGAVDYNGKVVIPFEYTSIAPLETSTTIDPMDGYVIASKTDTTGTAQYYRVNYKTGKSEYLGDDLEKMSVDDVYVLHGTDTDGNETMSFINQKGTLATVAASHKGATLSLNQSKKTFKLEDAVYFYAIVTETWTDDFGTKEAKSYITFNVDPFKATGDDSANEVTTQEHIGITPEDAAEVVLGENNINVSQTNYTYYKFTATEDCVYEFELDDDLVFEEIICLDEEVSKNASYIKKNCYYTVTDSSTGNIKKVYLNAEAGTTYYFCSYARNAAGKYSTLDISKAEMDGSAMYLAPEATLDDKEFTVTYNSSHNAYFTVTVPAGTTYCKIRIADSSVSVPYTIKNYLTNTTLTVNSDSKGKYIQLSTNSNSPTEYVLMLTYQNHTTETLNLSVINDEGSDYYCAYEFTDKLQKFDSGIYYFSYTNTTDKTQFAMKPKFYLEDNTEVSSGIISSISARLGVNGKSVSSEYLYCELEPGETVIYLVRITSTVEVKAKPMIYDLSEDLTIHAEGSSEDASVTVTKAIKYTIPEDGVYKVSSTLTDNTLGEGEVTSNTNSIKGYEYGANAVIETYTDCYKDLVIYILDTITIVPKEGKYNTDVVLKPDVMEFASVDTSALTETESAATATETVHLSYDSASGEDKNVMTYYKKFTAPEEGIYDFKAELTDNKSQTGNEVVITEWNGSTLYSGYGLYKGESVFLKYTVSIAETNKTSYDVTANISYTRLSRSAKLKLSEKTTLIAEEKNTEEVDYYYFDVTTTGYYTATLENGTSNTRIYLYSDEDDDIIDLTSSNSEGSAWLEPGKYHIYACDEAYGYTGDAPTFTLKNNSVSVSMIDGKASATATETDMYYNYTNTTDAVQFMVAGIYSDSVSSKIRLYDAETNNISDDPNLDSDTAVLSVEPGETVSFYCSTSKGATFYLNTIDTFTATDTVDEYEKNTVVAAGLSDNYSSGAAYTTDVTDTYTLSLELSSKLKSSDNYVFYVLYANGDELEGWAGVFAFSSTSEISKHETSLGSSYIYSYDLTLGKGSSYYVFVLPNVESDTEYEPVLRITERE